ncbi:hypothetical protein CDAR_97221 [Caerostris darwini]|uniref:Uncharacterized protein n=1 Tax=Caerostris darwini TaxID=1538125 RepID=A0AAV4QMQ5_9ARAC|nr:hypothetical protein CDAR_97221 [Caerostris darwini]
MFATKTIDINLGLLFNSSELNGECGSASDSDLSERKKNRNSIPSHDLQESLSYHVTEQGAVPRSWGASQRRWCRPCLPVAQRFRSLSHLASLFCLKLVEKFPSSCSCSGLVISGKDSVAVLLFALLRGVWCVYGDWWFSR